MSELVERVEDRLADFTRDKRVIVIPGMALVIGALSALVADALVWLIAVITNLAFFQHFSAVFQSPDQHRLGYWVVLVPVIGGMIIGLMARYGSEKIRGHGIPEAIEAILIGRSRMEPRVAVLKPLSSAISIGTGGPFGAEGPIIMTGGALGSLFAQLFHLTSAERKTLLVAGAAGGMAAIFATPVGGGAAGGGAAAVRVEAAQLHSGGRRARSRPCAARAAARRRARCSRCIAHAARRRRRAHCLPSLVGAARRRRLPALLTSAGLRLRGCFRASCRSTGCGGPRSAAWSSASAASSTRACWASAMTRSTSCCAARLSVRGAGRSADRSRRSSGRSRSARAPRAACSRRCSSWAGRSARAGAA